jgi:hypothetical protein
VTRTNWPTRLPANGSFRGTSIWRIARFCASSVVVVVSSAALAAPLASVAPPPMPVTVDRKRRPVCPGFESGTARRAADVASPPDVRCGGSRENPVTRRPGSGVLASAFPVDAEVGSRTEGSKLGPPESRACTASSDATSVTTSG